MTKAFPLLAALSVALLGGCASWFTTEMDDAQTLSGALAVYRASDEKKAIAVAADEEGRRTWGALYGSYSQEHANEKAVENCRKNARRAGILADCFLFAEGDAPSASTNQACRAGAVNAKRCDLQDRFFELYPR